jgi:hypothetical protein
VLLEEGGVLEGRGKLCAQTLAVLIGRSLSDSGRTLVGLLELGLNGKVRHFARELIADKIMWQR